MQTESRAAPREVDIIYAAFDHAKHDAPMLAHPEVPIKRWRYTSRPADPREGRTLAVSCAQCAARVAESIKALSKHGVDEEGLPSRVWRLPGEDLASVEELTRVHSKQFVQGLRKACEAAAPQDVLGSDTYFTFDTYNAAARTAGAACRLVDEVVARSKERVSPSPSGFLLSRPPGHHAVRAEPYGFCIFG